MPIMPALLDNFPIFGHKKVGFHKDYPKRPEFFKTIYDGNDDENFVKKTLVMTRVTALAAGMGSAWDIIAHSRPKTLPGAVNRIMIWTIPFVGSGLSYLVTANIYASLQKGNKKNQKLNHWIAGWSVGLVAGAAKKCWVSAIVYGFFASIVGGTFKKASVEGWEIWPEDQPNKIYGFATSYKNDYTRVSDDRGSPTWTR